MRGIVAIILTLTVAAIVGVGAYQLGLAQGLASTGTAVAPAIYYHPFVFGGFGFLFPLLFILLIFFAIGGAFRGGWGRRYDGPGHGYWGDRWSRLEELHRELHGEKPRETSGPSQAPPTGR